MRRLSGKSLQLTASIGCVVLICLVTPAASDDMVEPDASKVLQAMSGYLGDLKSFSVDYDVDIETVSFAAEKLEFSSSGEVTAQRPDKLHATRKGALIDAELFLDGKTLTIFGKKLNGYIQLPATSIDGAVAAVDSDLDFDAPGADFLVSKPFDQGSTDMVSGRHIGMAYVDGVAVHHLAFRGKDVDWQLWVQEGDKPLPLKYVITNKWMTGAPQYTLHFRNWNIAPVIDAATFSFSPPAGAKQLSDVSLNQIGELADEGVQ